MRQSAVSKRRQQHHAVGAPIHRGDHGAWRALIDEQIVEVPGA